jgi:hypothetical protein
MVMLKRTGRRRSSTAVTIRTVAEQAGESDRFEIFREHHRLHAPAFIACASTNSIKISPG